MLPDDVECGAHAAPAGWDTGTARLGLLRDFRRGPVVLDKRLAWNAGGGREAPQEAQRSLALLHVVGRELDGINLLSRQTASGLALLRRQDEADGLFLGQGASKARSCEGGLKPNMAVSRNGNGASQSSEKEKAARAGLWVAGDLLEVEKENGCQCCERGRGVPRQYLQRLSRGPRQPLDREERDDRHLCGQEQLKEVSRGPFIGFTGSAEQRDVCQHRDEGGQGHGDRKKGAGPLHQGRSSHQFAFGRSRHRALMRRCGE
jgi:hypothetical protein